MVDEILKLLMRRYGNLSPEELKAQLDEDGLGELGDAADELIKSDPELAARLAEQVHPFGDLIEEGMDVMPAAPASKTAVDVDIEDDIRFDQKACLKSCAGNCCRNKNYLMISVADIYRIVSSKAAERLGLRSTVDLFDRDPPMVVLFFNSEYGVYLPYIRFSPVGADTRMHPEEAPESICPFLMPIAEVSATHHKTVPEWAGKQAWGCSLLSHKPAICRLSPLGKSTGMVTGKVVYHYVPPALDCPACDSDLVVKVKDHLSSSMLPADWRLDASRLKIMQTTAGRPLSQEDRRRFNQILKEMYNVDALLFQHGLEVRHRPSVERLIEIGVRAARGDFGAYDALVEELALLGRAGATRQGMMPDREHDHRKKS